MEGVGRLKDLLEFFGFEKAGGGEFLIIPWDKVDNMFQTTSKKFNSTLVNILFGIL
jgi:hypothetical protein